MMYRMKSEFHFATTIACKVVIINKLSNLWQQKGTKTEER